MKTIPSLLQEDLEAGTTSLARLWTITCAMRDPIYMTDSDMNIDFEGLTYISLPGFVSASVQASSGGGIQNTEISFILNNNFIDHIGLSIGVFNNANVEVIIVDVNNLDHGSISLFKGEIGQIHITNSNLATVTLRGILNKAKQALTEIYVPTCRADLGDLRCKFPIENYARQFVVTQVGTRTFRGRWLTMHRMVARISAGAAVAGNLKVAASTPRKFAVRVSAPAAVVGTLVSPMQVSYDFGEAVWTKGNNKGLAQETYAMSTINALTKIYQVTLFFDPLYSIVLNDIVKVYPGCDKTINTCKKYKNILNMRAEPYVPGDLYIESAG